MKIAVIGAGAMGSIYGGRLSQHNEVYLIDTNADVVAAINAEGLGIEKNGNLEVFHPRAAVSAAGLGTMDVVILFVKALYSADALAGNQAMIGDRTYLMTLQNGAGHEDILSQYVPVERIIIGTTEDNGAVLAPGKVRHGGAGRTNIGMLAEDQAGMLDTLKTVFDEAGFDLMIHQNIQSLIWKKLLTNISLSAVTGLLKCNMGAISENPHANDMAAQLIDEAVAVAARMGLDFDADAVKKSVAEVSAASPEGITSICMDLRHGRKTEVDTISGAVVKAADKLGMAVPLHRFVVQMVHAMETITE